MVKEATHGLGANVVCECSGVPSVVPEGLQMTRKCGVFLEVGMYVDMGGIPVNMAEVTGKNIRIIGMNNHAATGYRPTMEMMLRHGISEFSPLAETSLEQFDRILAVNLRPVFVTAQWMAARRNTPEGRTRYGRIINIASTRWLQSEPGSEGYAASKGGIVSLTHALH